MIVVNDTLEKFLITELLLFFIQLSGDLVVKAFDFLSTSSRFETRST